MKCYRRCLWKKCTESKSDLHVEREGVLIDFDFATRSHLKLRTLFILLNDASERNINIMGKTCKSPGTINAEGNHRRSLERPGSLEGKRRSRARCTRQVFTKLLTCCAETTGSRFVVLEKFFIEISVVVNHAAIYVLPTAKHY